MATTKTTVSTSYTDLGAGARFLEAKGSDVLRVHFGGSDPGASSEAYHDLIGPDNVMAHRQASAVSSSITYTGTENCFVRSKRGNADVYHTSL